MSGFENFQYHKDRIPQDTTEKTEFFKQLKEQFAAEIAQSDKATAFLSKYKASCCKDFIADYARIKTDIIQYYEFYSDKVHEGEQFELYFQALAKEMLKAIMHKKLFNMQLRWRANTLKIPGLHVALEFEYWGYALWECPFIPEIEPDEIELMKKFLLQLDWQENIEDTDMHDWQDYDTLISKDEYDEYVNMPEWYEFYDTMRGTGIL